MNTAKEVVRGQGSGVGANPQSQKPNPGFSYSWHKDIYDRAIKQMVAGAGHKYAEFINEHGPVETGWLEWFEANHPELYKKYVDAVYRITKLWGDNNTTPQGKEEFKAAVKIEVDATKWAVDKYIEARTTADEKTGVRDSGLGFSTNPQSPTPNPQPVAA